MTHEENLKLNYLRPPCRPSTLDSFGNRRLLLASVRRALPQMKGRVLDIGCGEMPYKDLVLTEAASVESYVSLDLPSTVWPAAVAIRPDLEWDGSKIPLEDGSVDTVMLTEVLHHCPNPRKVLKEVARVLRPNGFLFLTVAFIWPIHCVPYDEFRYTPYSLGRFLKKTGFSDFKIEGTGGRNAVLGVVLGLWVRRRMPTSRVHLITKPILSVLLWPIVWLLFKLDERPVELGESTLTVGLCATAIK